VELISLNHFRILYSHSALSPHPATPTSHNPLGRHGRLWILINALAR